MRKKSFRSITITVNETSIKQVIALTIVIIIAFFIFAGMLTSLDARHSFSSHYVHEWASGFKGEHFVHILGMENPYFTQNLPDDDTLNVSALIFRLATSLNPDDPRSLLGRELPGFALFDGRIIVAGEGTDYTNLPVESAPPLEVIMQEREATKESLQKLEQLEKDREAVQKLASSKKVVHIIHTHNYESFLPELETDDPKEAHHHKINVTLIGEKLSQELEKRGIGTVVEKRDIQAMLVERGWTYSQSYDASRELIKEVMQKEEDLQYFFDIHRDSLPRKQTTVTLNGVDYAKTFFVIGGNFANYKENVHLAEQLHQRLEEKYPGVSRGVVVREGARTNGKFNQDLSSNSLLIEVGGIENTLEETYRTAEALADVFADYYWEKEAAAASKGEEER